MDSTQQELLMETVDHVENVDAILLPSTNIGITVPKKITQSSRIKVHGLQNTPLTLYFLDLVFNILKKTQFTYTPVNQHSNGK